MKRSIRVLFAVAMLACAASASAYDFTVVNSSSSAITGVLASEDGSTWGSFKLSGPIKPGGKLQLVWSPETDSSNCEWQVKATYADGSESEPAPFDFCEKDLELEFAD